MGFLESSYRNEEGTGQGQEENEDEKEEEQVGQWLRGQRCQG